MSAGTLISVEEYLRTSYSPDREYKDGVIVERNVGNRSHANLQIAIGQYIRNRRKTWGVAAYTELRLKARTGWYPIPDVCVYLLPEPAEEVPESLPFLWIEILSPDDNVVDVWENARQAIECGTPYVWIIDPKSLASELRTAKGVTQILDGTLRLPDSPIEIPLQAALDE